MVAGAHGRLSYCVGAYTIAALDDNGVSSIYFEVPFNYQMSVK